MPSLPFIIVKAEPGSPGGPIIADALSKVKKVFLRTHTVEASVFGISSAPRRDVEERKAGPVAGPVHYITRGFMMDTCGRA